MTFDDLNLSNPLRNALKDLGYSFPTTIQEKGFSVIMSGKDVVGIAQTGTGKTFAYLLPCLRQWQFSKEKRTQILILVPTRELVVQVVEEIKKLTVYMEVSVAGVYGGTNINTQKELVLKGAEVLVATPGRLIDLVLSGVLKLKLVKKMIIDEVDEMLALGFRTQLIQVMDFLPVKRQNLLFSATLTEEVETFISNQFADAVKIEAAPMGTPLENIIQTGYHVPNFNTKLNLLELLLIENPEMQKVLVFTSTRSLADYLYEKLENIFPGQTGVIHSSKAQNHRFNAITQFQKGTFKLLIATDLVARGLDIAEVTHVINFDVPEVTENYIHRIGRTGRADKKGEAIVFITEKETLKITTIERLMNREIPITPLPKGLKISSVLTEEEMPKIKMKIIEPKVPKREQSGPAFHEKKDKNKKTNQKIHRAEALKMKYNKPKSARGKKRGS
ncbi:MAG TPA: DEAD/DEAH box helicase [Cytophagaceae bacterium]|jgi:ATP-dependent RNA helicase RhlE|nr:DEAD/DEAH box helicase [Cytophagaceae bacterium]